MSGYGGQAGGFSPGAGGGSQGGQRKQSNHTYRPVTVRQLLDAYQPATDAEFKIDDVELDHVTFVGVIHNIGRGDTNVSMTVEDGTGEISVRMWLETASDDTGKSAELEEGRYVRVVGTMKAFNNKRSVNATVCKPITDFNEVLYNIGEVTYCHLYNTRGPPNTNGSGGGAMQGIERPNFGQTNGQRSAGLDAYSRGANGPGAAAGPDLSGFKPNARKIMQYIARLGADNMPEEGVNLDAVARAINMPGDKVREEVQHLIEDGTLYSTGDDDHVLPTDI